MLFFEKLCHMPLDLIFTDTPLPHSASRSIFLLLRGQTLGLGNSVGGQWGKILLAKEVQRSAVCVSSCRMGSYVGRTMTEFSL